MKKILFAISLAMAVNAQAAIIIDNTISGTIVNSFNALPVGNAAGLISQTGATYGERFSGQTVSNIGGFDSISGTPTSLTLLANASTADNIGITFFGGSNVIYGDLTGSVGEGALSILLDTPSNVFGFNLLGTEGGQFRTDFFAADGSNIGSFTQTATDNFFGFRTTGGSQISAVTLSNTDAAGLGFDNVTFDNAAAVPEPASLALLALGLFCIGAARNRER
jgi:hypothetical protein